MSAISKASAAFATSLRAHFPKCVPWWTGELETRHLEESGIACNVGTFTADTRNITETAEQQLTLRSRSEAFPWLFWHAAESVSASSAAPLLSLRLPPQMLPCMTNALTAAAPSTRPWERHLPQRLAAAATPPEEEAASRLVSQGWILKMLLLLNKSKCLTPSRWSFAHF